MAYNIPGHLKGLTERELAASREAHGYNRFRAPESNTWLQLLADVLKEPMLILLVAVSVIYVLVGDYAEAAFMFAAIVAVSAISFYQDNRSRKALQALEKLNEPLSRVIRNSEVISIPTHEIAVGDLCITEEGSIINADGVIVHSNDFSVNEASLTGESLSVYKDSSSGDNKVYSGTVAVSGLAVFEVNAVGANTRLGKIGESVMGMEQEISPLQLQIVKFVKTMAVIGIIIFLMVCIVSYWRSGNLIESILAGLTLAMSILPEEIPVAFTTFMAIGAWKLMREGVIVKRSGIVETLGSTTVICTDKTGTITENTMQLKYLYDFGSGRLFAEDEFSDDRLSRLIAFAMWSSEPVPFDPMEKTLHRIYTRFARHDERGNYSMIHEYPLDGKPLMMTHVFENEQKQRILAAKGAPEAILEVSELTEAEKSEIRRQVAGLAGQGLRILGVGTSSFAGYDFPARQQDIRFEFLGLTVFYDPPKQGIREVFGEIYEAGIKLKVITGDNAGTTRAIAAQAGIISTSEPVEGSQVTGMEQSELLNTIDNTTLFTRMFPEAKLAVVNALKQKGEIVAMLGDGVNDGPALKAAHIGVAMGTKGTEIAKAAASLVLTNDDLSKLTDAIAAGRRIYTNLKKAVQYIISIHIPIILTVSLPLFLGWVYPEIFTPVHVIFFELIMGPTCSVVYENEPMERDTMKRKPRKMTETFLNRRELLISIVQGLVITAGVLFVYRMFSDKGSGEELTRAMVFTTLIFSNILLSFANRSFHYSIIESFRNKNMLLFAITVFTLGMLAVILYHPLVSSFFRVTALSGAELRFALYVSAVSVLWFEVYKLIRRLRRNAAKN